MKNNLRYLARIFLETTSSFAINSGDKSLLLDNQIARDANGLPYLPGTSLAGIIQHACATADLSQKIGRLFGCSESDVRKKGLNKSEENGSRLTFTSGHLVGKDGNTIIDGITTYIPEESYYKKMLFLPQRDHVRITERGAADTVNHGKFDRELVYKGTQFCFEIRLVGNEKDKADWEKIIGLLFRDTLRLGAGTRKGSGKFKVLTEKSNYWTYDLTQMVELKAFLNKSASLNAPISHPSTKINQASNSDKDWEVHTLTLSPEDFYLFGTSLPDKDADNSPKKETVIEWNNNQPNFIEKYLLPASSIKGAIAHRVAYHYNLKTGANIGNQKALNPNDFGWDLEKTIAENLRLPTHKDWQSNSSEWEQSIQQLEKLSFDDFSIENQTWKNFLEQTGKYGGKGTPSPAGENNKAVVALFGTASDKGDKGQIGRVIIDDIYRKESECQTKVFNHVKIDRFTGGAYQGALFQEKVVHDSGEITIPILLYTKGLAEVYKEVFKLALEDLKTGALQLGGATTKGYGQFKIEKI